ncbi:DUF7660 family protein [Pedobacter sp.]
MKKELSILTFVLTISLTSCGQKKTENTSQEKQTFIKSLNLLRQDFLDNPENWENKTLPDFLKALSAYTEAVQGH